MKYYKTLEGMLTAAFEERGYKNDKGEPIKATETPMTAQEYAAFKKEQIQNKIDKLNYKPA